MVRAVTAEQKAIVLQAGEGVVIPIGRSSVRFLSVGADTGEQSSTEEILVPPQFEGPPAHIHRRTSHSWFVTEGQMRLTVQGESRDISPGGFVYVPAGSGHTFANPTGEPAAMVQFTTPGGFDRYLSELSEAFPEGSEMNPELVIEIMARHDTYPEGSGA